MSSDTSAYLSSQSEVSQTITAGIWEDPLVLDNTCGEEDTIDEVPSEQIIDAQEDKDDNPTEESEKADISSGELEVDCEDKDDVSKEKDEKDSIVEIDCKVKDDSLVGENEEDAASS
ncbi:MAG: hypothetical protein WBB56_06485, partial [Psychrobacillus psychrotolerans]